MPGYKLWIEASALDADARRNRESHDLYGMYRTACADTLYLFWYVGKGPVFYRVTLIQDAINVGGMFTPVQMTIPYARAEYMRSRFGFDLMELNERSVWACTRIFDRTVRRVRSGSKCAEVLSRMGKMSKPFPVAWWKVTLEER
jgi:hypothetical protein